MSAWSTDTPEIGVVNCIAGSEFSERNTRPPPFAELSITKYFISLSTTTLLIPLPSLSMSYWLLVESVRSTKISVPPEPPEQTTLGEEVSSNTSRGASTVTFGNHDQSRLQFVPLEALLIPTHSPSVAFCQIA